MCGSCTTVVGLWRRYVFEASVDMLPLIASYLFVINILSLALYGSDKERARRHLQRIPERVLLFVAFVGGALGATIAMWLFRHKTHHLRFTIFVPLMLLLQLAAIYLLFF